MTGRVPIAAMLLLAAAAGPLHGQGAFVAAARRGTERYRDQAVALGDGYRRIGPDFPSMGVHFVNPGLLVRGVVDPSRPTVLEYATIEGQPTLVGIAYAVLVDDTTPPPDQPAPAVFWHAHAGTVDEESFVLSHAEAARHHHATPGPKIAILHAWIWLANPDGLFATDNWALPFARLGFAAPESVTADAGRAMALAAGGVEYFRTLVRVVARPDSADQERLDAVLAVSASEVARTMGHGSGRTLLTRDQVNYLEAAWRRAWGALLAAGSVMVRENLASLE